MISRTSSPFTAACHAALLDELVKIGEAQDPEKSQRKQSLKRALKSALIVSGGITLGEGLAGVIGRAMLKNPPTYRTVQTAKIILPILTGAAVVLGDEIQRMRQERNKTDGEKGGKAR